MSDYRITTIKKGSSIVLGIVGVSLLAQYLGPELRGEYAVILNSAALVVVFLNRGLNGAFQAERRRFGESVLSAFVRHSILLFGAVFLLAALAGGLIDPGVGTIGIVAALSLLRMQLQSFAIVENIRSAALAAISGSFVEVIVLLFLWVQMPPTLILGLTALLVRETVVAALSLRALRNVQSASAVLVGRQAHGSSAPRVPSFAGSGRFFALTVLITVNYKVDVLFLSGFNIASESIGVFAVGVIVAEYMWIAADIFKEVQISRSARGGGPVDAARATRMAIAVTALIYTGFLALGPLAITLAFGAEYAASFEVAALMLVANICMIPCKILGAFLISADRLVPYLIALICAVAANCLLNVILIPVLGIYGAIAASIFSYGLAGTVVVASFSHSYRVALRDVLLVRWSDLAKR